MRSAAFTAQKFQNPLHALDQVPLKQLIHHHHIQSVQQAKLSQALQDVLEEAICHVGLDLNQAPFTACWRWYQA